MALVDSQLHLFPVAHRVAPLYADMALQFRLGRAPEVFYPVNGSAVTVGEHLCFQHQAVAITVSEQPGIAPEFIRINRTPRLHHYTRPPLLHEHKQYELALPSSAPKMVLGSPKAVISLHGAV